MKVRIAFLLCSGLFVWSFVQAGVRAQTAADSVLAGAYTEEQAMRGATVYADNCAMCHGEDLSGSDPIPPLMGAVFTGNWETVGDLFDKTLTSMPAYAPGSLTPEQTADVLAYMLSANKYPAGEAELAADAAPLRTIMIEPASYDSVLAGAYTEEQAMRGATVYADNCAMCHGEDLSGSDPIPPLMGAVFTGNWETVGDLFDKTLTSMPAYAPGSLTPEQTADVLAYMLSANKYPAGEAELAADAAPLRTIMIEPTP